MLTDALRRIINGATLNNLVMMKTGFILGIVLTGSGFSGGECQRIAIARAFHRIIDWIVLSLLVVVSGSCQPMGDATELGEGISEFGKGRLKFENGIRRSLSVLFEPVIS